MVRFWSSSANGLGDSPCLKTRRALFHWVHHWALWSSLTAVLLMVIIAFTVIGHIGFSQTDLQSTLQVIRITAPDQAGNPVNQSAVVDQHNNVVTYKITSDANHTSTVLFDIKHGVICYKPGKQEACFLRKMEQFDYESVHTFLNGSAHKINQIWLEGNKTQRHTEFLVVLGGHRVNVSTLQEPLRSLCLESPIYWTRKTDGPAKQRLIYFCIDICFPSNMCVSVCFYYLPE